MFRFRSHPPPLLKVPFTGLEDAGKTRILYDISKGKTYGNDWAAECAIVKTSNFARLQLSCWDSGAPEWLRLLWDSNFDEADALCFVVDSSRGTDHHYAITEFLYSLQEIPSWVPVLVLANKQDQPEAIPLKTLALRFDMENNCMGRPWRVQGVSTISRDGGRCLREGLAWLGKPRTLRDTFLQCYELHRRGRARPKHSKSLIVHVYKDLPQDMVQRVSTYLPEGIVSGMEYTST